jgi:hypothetical protein
MRAISDKRCRANEHTFCAKQLFFPEGCAVFEKMWKNIVEPDSPQMAVWCMCIACLITKATNTHSDYVIPIAIPLQQWLHEHTWTYTLRV